MALKCNLPTPGSSIPEFIDCQTINISYDITGLVTVSFTIISSSKSINLANYSTVYFGSNSEGRTNGKFSAGRVKYRGFVTSYEVSPIENTLVYEHRLTLTAWACRA